MLEDKLKKCDKKFNDSKFSFKVRQKTYIKAKKVKFCRRALLHDHMFKLIHAEAKA